MTRAGLTSVSGRIARRVSRELLHHYQSAIRSGLMPGQSSYTRFIVLTNIRCGSTMLGSYLGSHTNIRMFFELFHLYPSNVAFGVQGYERRGQSEKVWSKRNADPVEFLRTELFTRMPPHIGAVGFKLLHTHARTTPQWWDTPEYADWWSHVNPDHRARWRSAKSDLWNYLRGDRELKVILLSRENWLKGLVSAELAKSSGHWGVGATGGIGREKRRSTKVEISTENLKRDFEAAERQHRESLSFFDKHDCLVTTYERMTTDTAIVLSEIQTFLGVPVEALKTETEKQRTERLQDVVLNWPDVQRTLSGTRWEHLLAQ